MKFRSTLLILALVAAIPPAATSLDVQEIQELHAAGLAEETILSVIEASGQVFRLETEQIIALKKAGVSEAVIRALVETALEKQEGAKAEVQEDGTILLTNLDEEGESGRPNRSRANVVPSRPQSREYRTTVVLPETVTPLPPNTLIYREEDRGPYDIGYRWHPSWDENKFDLPAMGVSTSWPAGASIAVGYNAVGGYYFLPAAITADGPSRFGQFGFHLLPDPHLRHYPGTYTGVRLNAPGYGTVVHSGKGRHRHRP